MKDLLFRLDTCLRKLRPDYHDQLLPGLDDESLRNLEKSLGFPLPEDFKEFYRWKNGQSPKFSEPLIENWAFMDANGVLSTNKLLSKLLDEGVFEKKNWWNRKWIPFLDDGLGNCLCIDTEGNFGGVVGQILDFDHEDEGRWIRHKNLEKWLETIVVCYESLNIDEDNETLLDKITENVNPGYPIRGEAG